uniref:uncharacterized protein n=1 Tax=Semicossyphus pulcher TaxID=241346 RepID=UPI0037E97C89
MSKVQMMRVFVSQRLAAAAEEIFELFERTIEEYEEELCRSKEERERQQKLLGAVFNPEVRLQRADIQQLLVIKQEVPPEQKQWSPSLDQEDPPEPLLIKEKQEELWTNQVGEQLEGTDTADTSTLMFTLVPVEGEEDEEEEPQSLQLCQSQTKENRDAERLKSEADGEDCEGSEPDRSFSPDSHLQPVTHEETSHSSESETDDIIPDWEETGGPQSGLNPLQIKFTFARIPVKSEEEEPQLQFPQTQTEKNRDAERLKTGADGEDCGGSEPDRRFNTGSYLPPVTPDETECESDDSNCDWEETSEPQSGLTSLQNKQAPEHLQKHNEVLAGEKPFSCSVCGRRYSNKNCLLVHMMRHSKGHRFSCSHCEKSFPFKGELEAHLRIHTGEKPFSCTVCGAKFSERSCSVCGKKLHKASLLRHMRTHTGEKPLSCSVCGKKFAVRGYLKRHSIIHTGEKPFSCSVCGKRFALNDHRKTHMIVHTGEKPYSCSVCDKRFTRPSSVKRHKC